MRRVKLLMVGLLLAVPTLSAGNDAFEHISQMRFLKGNTVAAKVLAKGYDKAFESVGASTSVLILPQGTFLFIYSDAIVDTQCVNRKTFITEIFGAKEDMAQVVIADSDGLFNMILFKDGTLHSLDCPND